MTESLDLGLTLATVARGALDPPSLDFHIGRIISWNSTTASNQVEVLGRIMNDLPVLTSAGSVGLEDDVLVGILKVRTQYFILGRIVDQSTGLVNPQFPIVMYPLFRPGGAANDVIYYYILSSANDPTWEGRIRVSFPYVEIDGIWGPSGVGNTATYELRVSGVVVGTWTESTVVVTRRGPYDIRSFLGQDWAKIEVVLVSTTGALNNVAFQVLGCYFRDTA